MTKSNKVKYGLCNVHWAKLDVAEDGTPSYGAYFPWKGAVSLEMEAEGDSSTFYADNTPYSVSISNNGYSGDFESAIVPDQFLREIMGEQYDPNGVQLEDSLVEPAAFALAFQFEGDQKATRHVFYNCKMTRPGVSSKTTEDSKEPATDSTSLTASPLQGLIEGKAITKAKTNANTASDVYDNWFNEVYVSPNENNPVLGSLTVLSQKGVATGDTKLTVTPPISTGNTYVYKTGSNLTLPLYGGDLSSWTDWDGQRELSLANGKDLIIAEVNENKEAKKAGLTTVVSQ